jgi:Spy/CpxP family protein refolding chaperone
MMALGGLLLCGTAAFAQDAAPQAKKRGGAPTIEQLTTELKLTDEQKPKVEAALKEFQTKSRELRTDTSLSQEDRRTKTTALRDDLNKKMKEILTPEQLEKYQALRPGGKKGKKAADAPAATPSQ